MELSNPISITPRLLPGLQIGGAWVAIDYADQPGRRGRIRWRWFIDLPDGAEFTGDDLQSGCQGGSLREGLENLLSFLGAFAEAIQYTDRTGRFTDNGDLFPAGLAEWATENSDELGTAQLEVEETAECIVE